jgi:hypothetical protein
MKAEYFTQHQSPYITVGTLIDFLNVILLVKSLNDAPDSNSLTMALPIAVTPTSHSAMLHSFFNLKALKKAYR